MTCVNMFLCVTYSGIQLLEHEEVLFNYNEKVNIQEATINKGNMALEALDKEKRYLQSEIIEEKRQIGLKKKEVPVRKRLEGEIATLQIEVRKTNQHNTTAEVLKVFLNFFAKLLCKTKTLTKAENSLNLQNYKLISCRGCGWRDVCELELLRMGKKHAS